MQETYRTRTDDIEKQNTALLKLLADTLPTTGAKIPVISRQLILRALTQLDENFDREYGGFGQAPKFLHPAELLFCLHCYFYDGDAGALRIVKHTLEKMAKGGIYDQLGEVFFGIAPINIGEFLISKRCSTTMALYCNFIPIYGSQLPIHYINKLLKRR